MNCSVILFFILGTFILYTTIGLFSCSNSVCPYREWHGGSPINSLNKPQGSCWCGVDSYCMCTPSLAIDAIIETTDHKTSDISLVLVSRGKEPKGFAIPGGFVDVGESVEDATIREVKEETNLDLSHLEQFHLYSDPSRDKRRHTVSMVFRCIAKNISALKVGDDAKGVVVIPLNRVLELNFAFDHKKILADYMKAFHPTYLKPS